jgi:hypothetical protein
LPDQPIELSFSDPGSGAFDQASFTVSSGASQTINLTGTWTSREWRVDGRVRGSENSFTVNAGDYTAGGHILEVVVSDGTAFWSRTLRFTVH